MDDIKRSRAKDRVRQQMIDSYIGVTSADFCLADTATLVMVHGAHGPKALYLYVITG